MSRTHTVIIDPNNYNANDLEYLSEMLCDIIAERYGHLVETLSFTITATYTPAPDDTSEED